MTPSWPPPASLPAGMAAALHNHVRSLPKNHPLLISARTAALALSLTIGPAVLSFISSKNRPATLKGLLRGLFLILKRELGPTSFSFAITLAIGGGSALQLAWKNLEEGKIAFTGKNLQKMKAKMARVQPVYRDFVLNALPSLIAVLLMQSRRRSAYTRKAHIPWTPPISPPARTEGGRTSPTLDLTLLFAIRAIDAFVQDALLQLRWNRESLTSALDLFTFWASSARIMYVFFYEPRRLPRSYVKWIFSLANIDTRLVAGLQAVRTGDFSYVSGVTPRPNPLAELSKDLGYPSSWGEPHLLPAYGGPAATARWETLGVTNRYGVGGMPCEIIHGTVTGPSCAKNVALRGFHAFLQAIAIYLPRSFPIHVCLVYLDSGLPTLIARLLPHVSHDFYDGPFGCIMAGCLACGLSISIEKDHRRGEIALYVLPRAVRACLPDGWLRAERNVRRVYAVERMAFSFSLAALLTAAVHRPETLRGLSRWTLDFVMNGGQKRKRTKEIHAHSEESHLIPPPDTTVPAE